MRNITRNKAVTVNVLASPEHQEPVSDWSGPEIELHPNSQPIVLSQLICELLSEATRKEATAIQCQLQLSEKQIALELTVKDEQKDCPSLPAHLWPGLVTCFPRYISIEICEGTLTDPETGNHWRYRYSKKDNTIVLSKLAD